MQGIDWIVVSSLAAALSAFAAAISAFLSFKALSESRIAASEQRAASSMLQYVDWSLRYPKFATEKKYEHYDWFVFATLVLAREILTAHPNDERWKNQTRQQLAYHWKTLKLWPKADIEDFGEKVSRLVQDIVDKEGRA